MGIDKENQKTEEFPVQIDGSDNYIVDKVDNSNMFSIFDYIPIPILIYNLDTFKFVHVNQTAILLYGYTEEEFLNLTVKQIRPDREIPKFLRTNEEIKKSSETVKLGIHLHQRKDGTLMKMDLTVQKIPFHNASCALVSGSDVTEKEQINALERLERVIMELSLNLDYELPHLLKDYIEGLEDIFPGMKASILRVEGNELYNYASPTLSPEYVTAISGLEIGPFTGSCGTAAFTKKRVIVSDIGNDPLWKDFKVLALQNNLRACWSQPVFNGHKEVVATFANYYEIVKEPTSTELELFTRSASLLSIILENRKKSSELLSNNELFNYVNKATNDVVYDWDILTDRITWGHNFERIFGYTKDKHPVSPARRLKLIHGLDRQQIFMKINALMNDGRQTQWKDQYRFKKSNGTYIIVEDKGFVIRDRNGKGLRMIGVVNDITRQQTEAILIKIRASFHQIFGDSQTLNESLNKITKLLAINGNYSTTEIWLVNLDKTKLNLVAYYGNDAAGKTFFKESTNLQNLSFGEGLLGKVWENKESIIWKSLSDYKIFVRAKAAKKSKIVDMIGLPLIQDNEIIGVLALGTSKENNNFKEVPKIIGDLTTLLAKEIKRKQVEIELKQLIDTVPVIICQLDFSGKFKRINKAGRQLLGYSEEELLLMEPDQLICADDLKKIQECRFKLESENKILREEIRYISKAGKIIWLSWTYNPSSEEGLIFAVAKNMTEEKALANLLDMATEMARIGSWEIDLLNNKVYWSKITRQIHGVDENFEPDLKKSINFYRKDVQSIITKHIEEGIEHSTSWDLELPIITEKGNETWVRAIGRAVVENGKCIKLYGSFQDIHQLKVAELNLKNILKDKNEILERIGDGFFALDNNWQVKFWNRAAEELVGVSKETILGKDFREIFANVVDTPFYTYYKQAKDTGVAVYFEDYFEPLNKWFSISAHPSKTGLSVYFKDVTDRKNADLEIKKGFERFEKVAEATSDAIWEWNIEDNTLYWGEGFKTLFGYEAEKLSPTLESWSSHLHPDDKQRVVESLEKMQDNPHSNHWEEEYRYLRQDGNYSDVLDKGVLIRDENGKPLRIVGAMSDISALKNYEKSLKSINLKLEQHVRKLAVSNEELEQFAYMASHDLQEPLRMVTSFLTQLERKYNHKLDAKAHQYIDFAVDGAKRMRSIILDLLEYSRVGKEDKHLELVDLNEVMDGVLFTHHNSIKENNIKVHVEDLPTIQGFNAPLNQVFHNLISNAIKFRRKDISTKIEVLCSENKETWEFVVKDNGIGINKEYFPKIFLIFQRLHSREDYSGTGIGLSIVKKIVENFGGTLWVKSKQNEGSSFYFTIPKKINFV